MQVLYLCLYVAALVCFLLAAFNVPTSKANVLAVGLGLWVVVPLLQVGQKVF